MKTTRIGPDAVIPRERPQGIAHIPGAIRHCEPKMKQSMVPRFAAIALMLTAVLPNAHAEDKLGRLFLTPARRAMLEQQRQYNLHEQKTLEGSTLRLDGVVVRSTGKKTVWINGQAQNDNSGSLGLETQIAPGEPGQAEISAGNERQTELRVGQKINRATQEISDGLEGGRIEVEPPAGKPR